MAKELIVEKDPKSPVSEVFRTLRTNIQFMNTNKNLKTLLLTSTVPAEGKSLIAANLAATFAQANKRVVLIDCDMRKGRQHNIFGTSPKPGLSNYLSGIDSDGEESGDDLAKYIRSTEVENLYLIPAGNIPPNPSELIASEKMVKLLKELEELCDMVILDGTPSLIVTDAVILSRFVDSTIIVTAQNKTKMEDLNKVKKDIDNVGGKVAGVVINRIEVNNKQYQDRYYYYGHKSNLPTSNKKKKKTTVSYRTENLNDIPRKTESVNLSNLDKKEVQEYKAESKKQKITTEEDVSRINDILNGLNTYLDNEKNKMK